MSQHYAFNFILLLQRPKCSPSKLRIQSMAASLSLSLSLDTLLSSNRFPSLSSPKPHHHHHHFPIKSIHPSSTTAPFLDPISLHRLHTLNTFDLSQDFHGGSLRIRPMAPEEIDPTVALLAESFAESMWMPAGYAKLLEFFVRQYVVERRNLVPHSVMLVGFYREENMEEEEEGGAPLACTAEVSFDARGANAAPPTPTPPRNCPYVCNMTVKKSLRRRGIGRQLLKVCEELISQMKAIRKVYLHCRVIDTIPFQMYKKAGYSIVQTDSVLIWLTLQRRKYLMCKELPPLVGFQQDNSDSEVIHSDKFKDQCPEAAG